MCGRFTRKENTQHLTELLGLKILPTFSPRYNIAPSQLVACVRTNPETGERECVELKWGLVPSWTSDRSIGNKLINARGETVAEKPAFRKAFQQQRCLVLADGLYEWKREGKAQHRTTFDSKIIACLYLQVYGIMGRRKPSNRLNPVL
jgi:putative SOS response-associated peptidase YedK